MLSTTITTVVLPVTGFGVVLLALRTPIIQVCSVIKQWHSDKSIERRERQSEAAAIVLAMIRKDTDILAEPDRKRVVARSVSTVPRPPHRGIVTEYRLPPRSTPLPEPNGYLGAPGSVDKLAGERQRCSRPVG